MNQQEDEIKNITALLKEKDYKKALAAILVLKRTALGSGKPTFISNVNPKNLHLTWREGRYRLQNSRNVIVFYGWNFHLGRDNKLKVEIRDRKDKLIRTETDHLVITTPYICQLDIAADSGVRFVKGDNKIVLVYNNKDISALPVTWSGGPDGTLPPTHTFFNIQTNVSGLYLSVRDALPKDNADIVQSGIARAKQQWRLLPSERHPGCYFIQYKTGDKYQYLDVFLNKVEDGGRICLAVHNPDMVWRIYPAEKEGYYYIQSNTTGYYLDVFLGRTGEGDRICEARYRNRGQVWKFVEPPQPASSP